MPQRTYGTYDFPEVDFSWLGNLPGKAREAGKEIARTSALEDLQSTDPASLDQAAAKLLRAGLYEDASKLYQLSTGRRTQETAGVAAQAQLDYLKNWPSIVQGLKPASAGPAPGAPPATYSPPPDQQPVQSAPWPTGPQPPAGGLPPLRPQAAAPEPDTGRISEALAPPPPVVPGPRTAQLGGGPMIQSPNVPPPAPPGGLPPGVEIGRMAPGAGVLPPGFDPRTSVIPNAAPAPPRGRQEPFPVRAPEDTSAADKAYWDAIQLGGPGSKAAPGAAAAARMKFQDELAKTKRYSPDEIKYQTDQLHRRMLGQPQITRQEFDRGNQIFPKVYEEASKVNEGIQDQGMKSQNTLRTITSLQSILNNPDFISGPGAGAISKVQGFLLTLNEQARLWGVPENLLAKKEDINTTDTLRLQDLSESLVNSTVLAMLNNKLNAGTSNRDVHTVSSMVGNLSQTVEGRKDIAAFLEATSRQEIALAGKVRAYINKVGRTNIDPDEIRQIAHDFGEQHSIVKNPDGSLTPLGERMQSSIQLGGGRTPLQAFTTSDVAAAIQGTSRALGEPVRNVIDVVRDLQQNPIDVTGPINSGIDAVKGGINAAGNAITGGLNTVGGLLNRPSTSQAAQGGPSGGPFPEGGQVFRNKRTGERVYRLPDGSTIPLPKE